LELETQLNARDVTIELSESACDLICELGYSKTMGARPVARLIDDKIKKILANEIIHGKLVEGGLVIVDVAKQEFVFKIKKLEIKRLSKQFSN
jgi:ATPases with chaperone activity, ATP-binding subunit